MNFNRGVTIAGNWKMHHGLRETDIFYDEAVPVWKNMISKETESFLHEGRLRALVFPPATSLIEAQKKAQESEIKIGAQNAHWEKEGAFTGEVSAPMLNEIGVHDVLVGHSERRQLFGETDETVYLRSKGLLEQGFDVTVCIGETKDEREAGKTEEVLVRQLSGAFPINEKEFYMDKVFHATTRPLTIAYEPVWAIGTGLTASPDQAEEAHQIVRKWIWDNFGMEASGRTPILYGGSVKPANIMELLACPNVDGALVGGASLKAESYLSLVEAGGQSLLKAQNQTDNQE